MHVFKGYIFIWFDLGWFGASLLTIHHVAQAGLKLVICLFLNFLSIGITGTYQGQLETLISMIENVH